MALPDLCDEVTGICEPGGPPGPDIPPPAPPPTAPPAAPPAPPGDTGDKKTNEYDETIRRLMEQMGAQGEMFRNMFSQWMNRPDPMAGMIADMQRRMNETEARQKASLAKFRPYAEARVNELRAPAFTETEEAGRRVQAFDTFERERAQAKQNALERLGGLGHAPTSGIIANTLAGIDQRFDALRSQMENSLLMEGVNINASRKSEADRLIAGLTAAETDPSMLSALISGVNAGTGASAAHTSALGTFGSLINQLAGQEQQRLMNIGSLAFTIPQLQLENLRLVKDLFGDHIPF